MTRVCPALPPCHIEDAHSLGHALGAQEGGVPAADLDGSIQNVVHTAPEALGHERVRHGISHRRLVPEKGVDRHSGGATVPPTNMATPAM